MIRGRLANVFLETVASSLLGDTMLVIKINVSTLYDQQAEAHDDVYAFVCAVTASSCSFLAEQEDNTEMYKYSGDFCSRWAQTLPSSSSGYKFLCLQIWAHGATAPLQYRQSHFHVHSHTLPVLASTLQSPPPQLCCLESHYTQS